MDQFRAAARRVLPGDRQNRRQSGFWRQLCSFRRQHVCVQLPDQDQYVLYEHTYLRRALNPVGGYVDFVTGIPATPEAVFGSDGTLTESAANGTIGLANLYIPLNFKNAYVSSWNVALQQAIPGDTSLQLAYVANHGTRIDSSQNINLPSVFGESAAQAPHNIEFGKTAAVNQFFRGYSANYQSLQLQLTRRFSKGLAFTSALTWGKAQGYVTTGQDGALLFYAGDIRRNYTVLDFDRTVNWAQTVTYELPFGRNHQLLSDGPAAYILGGWKVSAIVTAVTGLPFTITTSSPTPGTTQTANLTGGYRVTHAVEAARPTWRGLIRVPSASPATNVEIGNTQQKSISRSCRFLRQYFAFQVIPDQRQNQRGSARGRLQRDQYSRVCEPLHVTRFHTRSGHLNSGQRCRKRKWRRRPACSTSSCEGHFRSE